MTYNIRGQKATMTDPDMGAWVYGYNVFGEQTYQKSAKSQITYLYYDKLGRMTQRNEPEGTATWTYDQEWIGALDLVVAPGNYEQSLDYDALGRPETVRTKLDSEIHLVQTTFDAQSRPAQLTRKRGRTELIRRHLMLIGLSWSAALNVGHAPTERFLNLFPEPVITQHAAALG